MVADMAVDMEVHMGADMEVDKVADMTCTKCIGPMMFDAKCTRLACLLSFASLFRHASVSHTYFGQSVGPNVG